MKLRKIIFTFAVSIFSSLNLFSQSEINLNLQKPDKVAVLGGNILSKPIETSYGYAVISEGKLISAFNHDGTILWQRSFSSKLNPYISTGLSDMIYVVSKNNNINLLNPGGMILWTSKCSFDIIENPLPGKDGRVFLRGKKNIACFGLNGICRWNINIENQDTSIPLTELNDGSFLAFLTKTNDNKSIAVRLSPFGNILEEIIFSGKVIKAISNTNGALLLFLDGTIGMCSVKNKLSYSKWLTKPEDNVPISNSIILNDDNNPNTAYFIFSNPAKIYKINTITGEILTKTQTSPYLNGNIKYFQNTKDFILISDLKKIYSYSKNGPLEWTVILNSNKSFSNLLYSNKGYLTIFTNNWVIELYRIRQTTKSSENKIKIKKANLYKDFLEVNNVTKSNYLTGSIITKNIEQDMKKKFLNGFKDNSEEKYISILNDEITNIHYEWTYSQNSFTSEDLFYISNLDYCEKVLNLFSDSGVFINTKKIASLIKNCNDETMLHKLIKTAGKLKYDPDGDLLAALDYILRNTVKTKENFLLTEIANSCYEICRFMGRPSFFERGQDMLTYMLYPQFDTKVKENARKKLDKIIEIKL